jgi:hypothetical protein
MCPKYQDILFRPESRLTRGLVVLSSLLVLFTVYIPPSHIFEMQFLLPLIALIASAVALPTTDILPREPALKPYQLRGVQSPIFHLYLQALPSNKSIPVMGPEAASEYFNIASTIQSTNTSMYLNIRNSTASYKPLSFNVASTSSPWALEGDTIITSTGSSYGRRKWNDLGWGKGDGVLMRSRVEFFGLCE